MKISNGKKELARIISENGGWREGAEFAVQGQETKPVGFSKSMPYRRGCGWFIKGEMPVADFKAGHVITNWHQTILSRAEYFHLYPAPDADGWIEWRGGECPVEKGTLVDVIWRDGTKRAGVKALHLGGAGHRFWVADGMTNDIIAYRLHKPEQAKPEFCESVMRRIPEPEVKPTIEQLAADYRNRKDYAERKQQEADAAKADAEDKLAELVAAGNALGLVLSVAEPELVITDWRDLLVGDIIEYVDGRNKNRVGMVGRVDRFDLYNADTDRHVRMVSDGGQVGWPTKWRFIRRP